MIISIEAFNKGSESACLKCESSRSTTPFEPIPLDFTIETVGIRQKILNYGACFDTRAYQKYESLWNCKLKGFRLLFITDNVARLSALCTLVQEMPPSDYIWLTTADRLFADGISAEIWVRGGRLDAPLQSILGRFRCRAPLP
jgi:hypothetical protein